MAWKLVDVDVTPGVGGHICTYVMDSDADAANLPEAPAGSVAIVVAAGGGVYMVNASGEWVKQ